MPNSSAIAPSRFSRHTLSLLLVTAAILWNVAALVRTQREMTDQASMLIVGLAFAQTGLAAAYFAWGRWNVAVRATAVLAAVFVSSSLSAMAEPLASRSAWLTFHLVTTLASISAFLAIRLLGLSLEHPEVGPSRRNLRQFSLLDLFSAVAGVALIAAASRWGTFATTHDVPSFRVLAAVVVAAAGITWICIVGPLALSRRWQGIAVSCGGAFFIAVILFRSPDNAVAAAISAMVQGLIIAAVAVVLRLGGYRLSWRSRLARPASTAPASGNGISESTRPQSSPAPRPADLPSSL